MFMTKKTDISFNTLDKVTIMCGVPSMSYAIAPKLPPLFDEAIQISYLNR